MKAAKREMRWTLCTLQNGGKIKKWCQYTDKEKAEAHAKSNGSGWFVELHPANPERMAKLGGRRSCCQLHKVGLPQY